MIKKIVVGGIIVLVVGWFWSYVLPLSFDAFLTFASVTFNEAIGLVHR